MTAEIREKIDLLAYEILKALGENVPIENMDAIVDKLGGRVVERDVFSISNDGELIRDDDDNGFTINVPQWQPNERRKFTIAHELGHLFLHMGYMLDDDLWAETRGGRCYRNGNSDTEQQANEFAAAFLMPQDEYKRVVESNSNGTEVNILEVARYFKVSVEAATYRGKWLGVLRW